MPCSLCLNERVLRNSHIIPEFLYSPGYDEKHRLIKIQKNTQKTNYEQKGLREKLLCDKCETLLNDRFEKYFDNLWRNNFPKVASGSELVFKKLDYTRFKLFLLSILWRASVSKKDAFRKISLGDKHENNIRKMILENNPSNPEIYPVMAQILVHPETNIAIEGVIMSPITNRFDGKISYTFLFGGCSWNYVVSSHPVKGLGEYAIDREGTFVMPVVKMTDFPPIDTFMREHMLLKHGNKTNQPR